MNAKNQWHKTCERFENRSELEYFKYSYLADREWP